MPSSFSYLENTTGENTYWKIASPPPPNRQVSFWGPSYRLESHRDREKKMKNMIDRGYGSKKGGNSYKKGHKGKKA